jgi:hypothetical protein
MSRLVGNNDISAPKNIQNKGFTICLQLRFDFSGLPFMKIIAIWCPGVCLSKFQIFPGQLKA